MRCLLFLLRLEWNVLSTLISCKYLLFTDATDERILVRLKRSLALSAHAHHMFTQ